MHEGMEVYELFEAELAEALVEEETAEAAASGPEEEEHRKKLSDAEWSAIARYTHNIKVDADFDIAATDGTEDDYWEDTDGVRYDLGEGLQMLYDAVAYPLQHEGLEREDARLIANLFKEFGIINDAGWLWLMDPEGK